MPPGTITVYQTGQSLEELVLSLKADLDRLRTMVEAQPLLFRKDVERLLGLSPRTLSRRLKSRSFPKPIYDAGRPKWRPTDFNGQDKMSAVRPILSLERPG
jgi:hypothetical protein